MQQLLLSSQHLLDTIKKYVIHYEIQQLGSLHAHIILWVVKNDIENITNEIIAFILAIFDEKKNLILYNPWMGCKTRFTKL